MKELVDIVAENWGLRHLQWQPLPTGHTNSSYLVGDGRQRAWIARASWPNKPLAQLEREAVVLAHLHTCPTLPAVPRICHTRDGRPWLHIHDDRWLQLFERIKGLAGTPGTSGESTQHALQALAHLHGGLAGLLTDETSTVAWLLKRYRRVVARPTPPMLATLAMHYAHVLQHIGMRLAAAAEFVPGPVQYLHGDYHPGNLLFDGSQVSGIVDFDDIGFGSSTLELAFALFAFSRDVSCEDHFDFDPGLWTRALHAYSAARAHVDAAWLLHHRDDLRDLFCIDQVLIHVEAAQRGLWSLVPGIGFLACWHHLQALFVTDSSSSIR